MFVLATAWKDLRRRLRDPAALCLWLGIPIAIAAMIQLAFGGDGDGAGPRPHVLVCDRDDTALSELLLGALGSEQGAKLPFEVEAVTLAEGRERIDDGDASALLVIPAGFTGALLLEEPCTLELVTNPAQRILPGMVEEALTLLADAVFYAHRVFGEPLRAMAAEPPPGRSTLASAEVARIATEINTAVEGSIALLSPPAIELVVERPPEEPGPERGLGALFLPSMLFMTLFFLAQGMSEDLWVERSAGTLRRALVTPNRASAFLLGKLLAAAVLTAAISLAGMVVARGAFGIELANLPLATAWAGLAGLMLALLFYVLQLFASSQRAGNLLGNLVLFPLLMLGGSFFPFEAMPDGMAAIGRLTPNGWALEELKAILFDAFDPAGLAGSFAALALVCAALFAVSVRRLAGGFAGSA